MSQDSLLQRAVIAELSWEPSVTAAHLGVTAEAGVVTLSGHVESYAAKRAAEQAAGRVAGVLGVVQKIEVHLPYAGKRSDKDIAAAAINCLAWDVSVPSDVVKVKIETGWVTLAGQVDWQYQKEAAEQDVSCLSGVIGVSNQITLAPRTSATGISDEISHAVHRSWFSDDSDVMVTAEGGRIHLTGTVHSPHDRQIAVTTACAAPGTTDVEDDICID